MSIADLRQSAPFSARTKPKYPGIRVTCSGNQLVTQYVETRVTDGGVFSPITPSTEGGEIYQASFASGELNVWGQQKVAAETEGEHAAQGGATAYAVTGRRTVNFTSGQGIDVNNAGAGTTTVNYTGAINSTGTEGINATGGAGVTSIFTGAGAV